MTLRDKPHRHDIPKRNPPLQWSRKAGYALLLFSLRIFSSVQVRDGYTDHSLCSAPPGLLALDDPDRDVRAGAAEAVLLIEHGVEK